MASVINSIIHWKDNSFDIQIDFPLRKAGIGSITSYGDYMRIWFMNDTGLSIPYPDRLDNLLIVIERELVNWDGYHEGYGLPAYIIKRIMNYIHDNFNEINEAILKFEKRINT